MLLYDTLEVGAVGCGVVDTSAEGVYEAGRHCNLRIHRGRPSMLQVDGVRASPSIR